MAQLLDEQIDFLASHVKTFQPSEQTATAYLFDLEVAIALSVEVFDLLRRKAGWQCPPENWNEETARRVIPDYQRWLGIGDQVFALIRQLKRHGTRPAGVDEFMRAYMECKPIATEFDRLAESHRRWQGGDRDDYRPLTEVADELCDPIVGVRTSHPAPVAPSPPPPDPH